MRIVRFMLLLVCLCIGVCGSAAAVQDRTSETKLVIGGQEVARDGSASGDGWSYENHELTLSGATLCGSYDFIEYET